MVMFQLKRKGTRLYSIWTDMKRRCTKENRQEYKWYGARGIAVCGKWQDFDMFAEWALNNGYAKNLTIDRRDNNGDYEPDNCRWVTIKVQERNRRNSKYVLFQGRMRCLSELAEDAGLKSSTVLSRIVRSGWSVEDALTIQPTGVGRLRVLRGRA